MPSLADQHCGNASGQDSRLERDAIAQLTAELGGDWQVIDEHHLEKTYLFPDFQQALDFVNRLAVVAEEEQHHPDILLTWGRVRITLWSHSLGGLSKSDFIMAAKIDRVHSQ